MRKVILSTMLLVCLSSVSMAMDINDDNTRLYELEMENKNLSNIIAKMHANSKNASILGDDVESNDEINALKNENKDLQSALSKVISQSKNKPSVDNDDLQALKNQNQSLRETIAAQGKTLISADSAIKTAKRLSVENAMLKKRLEQVKRAGNTNTESAKGVLSLKKKIRKLELALNKERKNGMADRVTIQRFEAKISGDELASCNLDGDMSKKVSFYKSNIAYLEAGIKLKDKEIAFLKLENQELNARINLAYESDDLLDTTFYSPNDDSDMLFDDEMAMQQ